MTVQTNTNVASFNGNGVTQIFPIAFKFNNDTDLVVLLVDDATGSVSQLTLNSDYTVSGEGDEEGGLINITVAPAVGRRLKVTRVVDILQLTDLRNQGKFFAEVHEDALDLLTMIAQQHESGIRSSLRVAESDPEPARIPPVSQRAGKVLSFDVNGDPQVAVPITDSAAELRLELASPAGGGIVGFDPETAYPAGTVGHKLSDQISATQGRGSLMQYVPEAERAAILAGTSSFDCTAALKQAVDENDFVLVGPGHYSLFGDVQVVKPTIVWGAGGTLYQKSVNTRLLWSTGVNDVAYIGLKVRGYGVSDTASTYNADANTANAMARGLDFWNGQRFTAVNCDVRGFKNYGIQAAYSSFVTITGNHIEGTYPDADIPLFNTGRQQMGVHVYAKWYAAENAPVNSVIDGSAAPHGNHTIEVSNNRIGNTAIAICALPGFSNVRMDGNTTFGGLTQHSFYAYPADGLQVTNNICGADPQSVGIKISNNVGANRREVKNVSIRGNLIKHTSGPSISVEIFDRLLDNSFVSNKSGSFFNGVMIQDNTIEDFHDIGMSLACVHGGLVAGNIFKNQNGAGGSRTVLDLRSFGGIIEGNRCEDSQYSFLGGSGVLDEPVIVRDNYLNNISNAIGGAYMALAVAVEPMLVEPTHWYTAGNLVYNSGNGQVYRVTQSGYTGATIPTRTSAGTEASGGVTFEWFGAFASLMTKVDVYDNILDATKATASTIALSLNNAKFQSKVKGNWAIPAASTAQVQGRIDLWSGNNLRNTSKSAQLASGDGAAGPNRNDWNGTAIPTTGRFEKGDVVWNSNPAASGVIGWVCTGAGTPGTWKSFGTIAA